MPTPPSRAPRAAPPSEPLPDLARPRGSASRAAGSQPIRDAIAVVAIASGLRLDDGELEARRVQLVRTALDRSQDASASLQAWVHQLRSEYRGSHTSWDLSETSVQLTLSLVRFDATVAEMATELRSLFPELIEQGLKAREGPA